MANPFRVENRERIGEESERGAFLLPIRLSYPICMLALVRQVPKSAVVRELLEESLSGLIGTGNDSEDLIARLTDELVDRAMDEWDIRMRYNRNNPKWQGFRLSNRFKEYVEELSGYLDKRSTPIEIRDEIITKVQDETRDTKTK